MATVTKGRTFVSGETVTPAKLNELVDNATVTSIVDADVSASAAIALSKLATGALPTGITVASANLVDGTITSSDLATVVANALLPAGAVMPFAMNSAPSGWLAADGSPVSRADYAALFAAIGTTHGAGNGTTTFNLPDLRGIFVRGSGSQTIGGDTYSGVFAAKQMDANEFVDSGFAGSAVVGSVPATRMELKTSSTENRPANIALLYCIKF